MRDLVAILMVGGCSLLWSGAVAVSGEAELHCGGRSCNWTEEIGPSGSKSFNGYCDGLGNTQLTASNSALICHKAKGLTCTAAWIVVSTDPHYWSCTCTNWNDKQEAHPDIDISCPAPS